MQTDTGNNRPGMAENVNFIDSTKRCNTVNAPRIRFIYTHRIALNDKKIQMDYWEWSMNPPRYKGKPGLWRSKQFYINESFLKLCRKQENYFLQMLIYDKQSRFWSGIRHRADCGAWTFCPSIRRFSHMTSHYLLKIRRLTFLE